ncbi:MAG: FMN-binding protein [Pseudomonadales bacterium]|nr:FMN-binding protein [Pseudomonadales bacterium]
MHDLAKGIIFLVAIGCVCGGVLHFANAATKENIDTNRKLVEQRLLKELVGPDGSSGFELGKTPSGNCSDGLLLKQVVPGYAGPIEFLLYRGLDPDILRIRTLEHRETPGIGDFIDSRRDQYIVEKDAYTAAQWQTLDAVSGATVTSGALNMALGEALAFVQIQCQSHRG